ncbi:hemerythrin domain-containing protein [Niveibacterium sp. SC-1]|uniref:hemerythrin domain-containing protein n=1 Tax=Niveibacterium sp. SC-1 TaxID=3135646 RepID=UPI00311E2E4A
MPHRRQRLYHLSLEHKTAMSLANTVRELVPEDESALPDISERVREVFQREMLQHFGEEEKYVYPQLVAIGREDLRDRMAAEHVRICELADSLAKPTAELIEQFCETLRKHVEFEEDVVFLELERAGY